MKPSTLLYLDERLLHLWDRFLGDDHQLYTTSSLFLHACRPYWAYYLERISHLEVDRRALVERVEDPLTLGVLERRRTEGALRFREDGEMRPRTADASGTPLVVTTVQAAPLARRLAWHARPLIVLIPDRLAEVEVEPAWRAVKAQIAHPPSKAFVLLGWQKVVHSVRLAETYGVDVVDLEPLPRGGRSSDRSGRALLARGRARIGRLVSDTR